jgi:hypothetical protein
MYFTCGLNTFDGHPQTINDDWDAYIGLLREAHNIQREATDDEKRHHTPWTAPFILWDDGEGRGMDNVRGMGEFALFDLDAPGWTLDRINGKLYGFRRAIHTTTKSRPSHQRWRVIVRLDRIHSVEEYGAVWHFFNDLLDGSLDPQTKNANRILYLPAQWRGADNVLVEYDGAEISVDEILQSYAPVEVCIVPSVQELTGTALAPMGIEIITPGMIAVFRASNPGGRFWKLLVGAASRFKREGWSLSVEDLTHAALSVSAMCAPGVKRHRPEREAARALGWVEMNITTMTPMEKLRNRSRWMLSRRPGHGV